MVTCRRRPNRRNFLPGFGKLLAQASVSLALCSFSSVASAQNEPSKPEGSIELILGHTDNLDRTAVGEASNIYGLGVGFAGRTERRWLRAELAGDVKYLTYDADVTSYEDQVLGSVDAVLDLQLVPDIVLWDIRFDFGQVRIDPEGALSPSNLQGVTSWSTGPQVNLPLGDRTVLQFGGMVSDQSFEETQYLDGRIKGANLGLVRQINPVTQLSLVAQASETEYDDSASTYDIGTLSLEYQRELASGEAFASIGRGRVKIDGDSTPTTVAQLLWNRAVGARSRIEFCFGRELTDAGNAFVGAGVAVGCPGDIGALANVGRTSDNREQGVVPTTSPLVRTGGSVSFELDGTLGKFRATFSMAQDRFEEDTPYDNDSTILELSGSRDFARLWRGEISAGLWVQDYFDLGEKNEDQFVRLSISREFARRLRLTLSYEHVRRTGGFEPFDANDYFLTFGRDFGH